MRMAHLHGHTTFSFLDGYGTPDQLKDRIVELGHTASAVTDHGNIFAHVPLQKVYKKAGIKPIFGCEFYVVDDMTERTKYNPSLGANGFPHVTIIAITQKGYENLLKLVTIASSEGFYYKARIDWNAIAKYQEGLAVFSGCVGGYPSRFILGEKGEQGAYDFISERRQQIERYYIEIVPEPGLDISHQTIPTLIRIAQDLNCPMIVTADAHFPSPDDYWAQDTMLCMGINKKVTDDRSLKLPEYQYYCSSDELLDRSLICSNYQFRDELIRAIEITADIADECSAEIPIARSVAFPGAIGQNPSDVLRDWIEHGFSARIQQGLVPVGKEQEYRDRIEKEFKTIAGKGFADYLLTLTSICRWAKEQDSLVMNRGSAGGCLLLWILSCGETDSIAHDLSFERFYDDTRTDPPDVDVDFETEFRPRVIDYIFDTFGHENCSQVAALTLLRAKNAVADIASVYDIPRSEYDALSIKLDSKDDGFDAQIDAVEDEDALAVLAKYPILRLASRLIGQCRNQSVNAAGFVISAEPLTNVIATIKVPGKHPFSSVDKHGAGDIGLLKFDLLGVAAFDVIGKAIRKVFSDKENATHFLYTLPLDDPKVYETARRGDVAGVFQLDGAAIRVASEIGLDTFEELYACSALCRPGAVDHVPLYKHNKYNKEDFSSYLQSLHPTAANIVRDTYGILLYQEQVMRICRELADMPWERVNKLRKRISAASFNGHALGREYGDDFMSGCLTNGVSVREATSWWEAIKKHGIYCVSGDTVLDRGSSGQHGGGEITIAEYFKASRQKEYVPRPERGPFVMQNRYTAFAAKFRGGKCNLLQMDEDGRVRPGSVKEIVYNGKIITYTINTEEGDIRVTANHKMLTQRGYVRCDELTTDDSLISMSPYEGYVKIEDGRDMTSYTYHGVPSAKTEKIIIERANGICEICGKSEGGRFENAHILKFAECEEDYAVYHSADNIAKLCNNCHKSFDYAKKERIARWSKGRATHISRILSITEYGEEDTYCVVMDTAEHNFVANGFISHNSFNKSHCVTYGIIGYWMLWLKTYHPSAYYEAYLNVEGASSSTNELLMKRLIIEYRRTGGTMVVIDPVLSQRGFSSPIDDLIVGGWQNLKGVGEKMADQILAAGPFDDWKHIKKLSDEGSFPQSIYYQLFETGITQDRDISPQATIKLASWAPIEETAASDAKTQKAHNLERPGDLPDTQRSGDTNVAGYITARHIKGRTGSFRGETILWGIEDETGLIVIRVPAKNITTLGQRVKKEWKIGDYVAVQGWWAGDVLFMRDFVRISRRE